MHIAPLGCTLPRDRQTELVCILLFVSFLPSPLQNVEIKLIADGGEESKCGWLRDKYGVRWQIIPEVLIRLTKDPDPEKSKRVWEAMMKMKKIIVKDLEEAYHS